MNRNKTQISEDDKEEITAEQENALSEICTLLSQNNSPDFINEFFCCLFTPSELKDIATRWLLVQEIDKGTTQRDIAKKFHISLCKITRGSKELKKDGSAFRKLLDKLQKN